jgi:hypothetical protein
MTELGAFLDELVREAAEQRRREQENEKESE